MISGYCYCLASHWTHRAEFTLRLQEGKDIRLTNSLDVSNDRALRLVHQLNTNLWVTLGPADEQQKSADLGHTSARAQFGPKL
jgi:hypothetical protein